MGRPIRQSPQLRRNSSSIETSPEFKTGEVSNFLIQPEMPEKPLVSENGTGLAIINITSGVVALSADPVRRGGANNSARRESYSLKAPQIANLLAAGRHAMLIGLPFNRMITIHWEAAGVPLAYMAKATGRFVDLMSKALARHGSRTAWMWVHENGDKKGGHCHLLAHVPAHLVTVVTRLQRGWLRQITGKPYKARVIHSKPIGRRLGWEISNPPSHATNLETVLDYIFKEADRNSIAQFGLTRYELGGRVIGKRCATSQNIAKKARADVGGG